MVSIQLKIVLCRLGYLNHNRYVQGRLASGAYLSGRYPDVFSLHVDIRWHRMGADGAMDLPFGVVLNE
jgi:hypothetical protein